MSETSLLPREKWGDDELGTAVDILGILRLCKQEERYSHKQDFISEPAWNINSEQMESGPAAYPGFRCWRVDVSSSTVKSPGRL